MLVYALGGGHARLASARSSCRFFQLQTSELGKVLLVVALAAFVVDRMRRLGERETTSRIMLLALLPAMLVIAQPDLGTGLVYIAIALAIAVRGGHASGPTSPRSARSAAAAVVIVLVAAPAVGVEVLKPYQVDRLTAFVNPAENPAEEGYQLNQSLVAIGAGGKTGRGDEATQTKLDFLPEHHTDFVFSVVGEEFGFMGAALVLSLFALLIWRCLRILTMAKNLYGTLIAGGITAMLMLPDLRQRGHDHRDHAHHRRHPAADELRRLVGDRDLPGPWPSAVDPRAGARDGVRQGPGHGSMMTQ